MKATLDNVHNNLADILATIDSLNHYVDVYVMGYYNPFPYLTKEQQAPLMSLLDALNLTIETLSKKNGDIYVPTEKVIDKPFKLKRMSNSSKRILDSGLLIIKKKAVYNKQKRWL